MTKRFLFWLGLITFVLVFLFAISAVLLPFVLGILSAYFLDPAADRLERCKLSRTAATSIIIALFFSLIILLGILIVPTIASEIAGLAKAIPGYIKHFEATYVPQINAWLGSLPLEQTERIKEAFNDVSSNLLTAAGKTLGGLFNSGMAFINLLSLILITPVVAFYLLRDWDKITAHFDGLLPRDHAPTIREQLHNIDSTLAAFIRGQLNVCFILAAYYVIGLSIVGLNFAILVGLISGILVIIPYVGTIFSALLVVVLAFLQFGEWAPILTVVGVFAFGQLIEGTFITPKLVGDKVGLHPVWIIFGMLAGGALLGFVGVLLAVPLTAIIGVLTRFATKRYLQSSYYQGSNGTNG